MPKREFVHLHCHTEFSCFDGQGKQEAYMERAKELGHPAIAFTEHGSMRGVYKANENAQNIGGIKAVHGIEFYVSTDHTRRGLSEEEKEIAIFGIPKGDRAAKKEALYQAEVRLGVRERFHLTAIAKDQTGLKNLFRLSSLGWTKGFFKRPRIDMKLLEQHHEGIILLSGCPSGYTNHFIIQGDMDGARKAVEMQRSWLGDDFYLEIMPHASEDQIKANKGLALLSKEMGVPLVATQDAHWLTRSDREAQEALLCINTNDYMANPDRFKFDENQYHLASRAEVKAMFARNHPYLDPSVVEAAIDKTMEINEKISCKLEIDRFKALVPSVEIPSEFKADEFLYLKHLCMTGWDFRDIPRRALHLSRKKGKAYETVYQEYIKRLRHELEAIRKQHVQHYFLVIWDLYNWARENDVAVGPGRGSAGGCLVSYLLGITQIDPIEHALLFERFLAPGRIDLPDIDCDFEARRRDEVIAYLRNKYGPENTAQIATVTTLKGKAVLRDVSRVLNIPKGEVDEVTDSIIERSSGDERASQCLEDSFKEFKVCQDFNTKYPKVLALCKKLEGQARGLGMHAAGVVVSPQPIIELCPLEIRNADKKGKEPVIVTAFDMYGAAAMGLMKIDILGLRNLDSLDDCINAIHKRYGKKIDLNWIDMEDKPTLDNFTAHKYCGIFQFDTPSADKICEGVNFEAFEDVVAMIALDRPGTARSGLATEYIKRKRDPKARVSIHPLVDEICKDTLGVIVYQEHVLRIFREVAGFDPATADSLRKKIAKKWGDEAIGKERENFVRGAMKNGLTRELAEDLISKITFFGSYGFNKSHATAYGTIAYWQMWLKTHYPVEFMWSLLANEPNDQQIKKMVKECRAMGIEVRGADVNASGVSWKLDDQAIVASMSDLKGVGMAAIAEIEPHQPFTSFIDFIKRTNRRRVHKKVVQVLLKSGALNTIIPNQKWLLENLDNVWGHVAKQQWNIIAKQLLNSAKEADYNEEDAQQVAAEVNPTSFGKHPVELFKGFLHGLKVTWTAMDAEELWEKDHVWLYGMILEVKYNQVGDFHTGPAPEENEKKRMKWGSRYANVNIEDLSGKQNRVKVDHDIFDDYRHIVDKGVGTIVALHCSVNKKFKSLRAHMLVNVAEMKKKMDAIASDPTAPPLTWQERCFTAAHPVSKHSTKNIELIAQKTGDGFYQATGIVTHVNRKLDKNLNEMGFFGLLGHGGYLDCLCFASCWDSFNEFIKPGRVVKLVLKREKSGNFLTDDAENPVVVVESL